MYISSIEPDHPAMEIEVNQTDSLPASSQGNRSTPAVDPLLAFAVDNARAEFQKPAPYGEVRVAVDDALIKALDTACIEVGIRHGYNVELEALRLQCLMLRESLRIKGVA